MASSVSASAAMSKASNPAERPAISQPQISTPSSNSESFVQRRSGGSGSFGAGSHTRGGAVGTKSSQPNRQQHKNSRKPRLGDEDAVAESAVLHSTNNRRGQTSITHLMTFNLPPRPAMHSQNHHARNSRRNPTWGLGSGYHAADKARFIHANYRFIVDPRGDYHRQAVDADVHLDWTNVLQILASGKSQTASCPICLSSPVAPRMAKCGHIFCLPCLIRYMHSTDDTIPHPAGKARWKKCPICWDSIYVSETRPVRWFIGQEGDALQEGGDVVLRLMMRKNNNTLALPRDGAQTPPVEDAIPWYFAAEMMDYARVMKGTEDYMLENFDREIDELRTQEKEDELLFGEETLWTKRAISLITDAKEKVKGIGNPPSAPERVVAAPQRPPIQFNDSVPEFYAIQQAAKSGQSMNLDRVTAPSSGTTTPAVPSSGSKLPPVLQDRLNHVDESQSSFRRNNLGSHSRAIEHPHDPTFFFYQALLHHYLSPLDIRILKSAFGDYSNFPTTVLPRVERVSTGHIVDDDLRRRAKYLSHLPYGCEVSFLECNWTDVVTPDVLEHFQGEIDRRRKRNQEKDMREEKERARAEREEDDKRWAAARRKRPSISKAPATFEDLPTQLGSTTFHGSASSIDLTTASTSPPWQSSLHRSGSAFASLASPSTSPSAPRTVWGTTAIAPSSPQLPAYEHEASEHDGWLQGWEKDLLQEEELVSQVKAMSTGAASGAATPVSGGGGKKKKHKKITLMSTNVKRGA